MRFVLAALVVLAIAVYAPAKPEPKRKTDTPPPPPPCRRCRTWKPCSVTRIGGR